MLNIMEECRLCLSIFTCQTLVEIFPSVVDSQDSGKFSCNSIAKVIEDFTNLKIVQHDGFPQRICKKCLESLTFMVNFREASLNADNVLKHRQNRSLIVELKSMELCSMKSDENVKVSRDFRGSKPQMELCSIKSEEDDEATTDLRDFEPQQRRKKSKKCKAKIKMGTKRKCCDICGKLFIGIKLLRYHMNTHNGLKPYSCTFEDCEKNFTSPAEMHGHYKRCHTDFYRYECTICGRKFKIHTSFKDHMSYHLEPQLPCEICGKMLRNQRSLKKHIMSHTGERPFPCDQCTKSFQNRYNLNVHKRVHTKEKPFVCYKCGELFGYNSLLKAHTQKRHSEEC